ncbi:MAG TPA: DUF2653 family protein [Bacillota bacterium]|nr:DUF2653 family protein [Bacillota bacterium]
MKITLTQTEMIDAVAIYGAREQRIPLDRLSVELFYEENKGFYANIYQDGSHTPYIVSEQQMIDAVAGFLRDYHRFEPGRMEIELFYEEDRGFSVEVETNR